MKHDQIYDSSESISQDEAVSYFPRIGYSAPAWYREFMAQYNDGFVHPSASQLPNGDSLIRLFPISGKSNDERVELVEFDAGETSIPA